MMDGALGFGAGVRVALVATVAAVMACASAGVASTIAERTAYKPIAVRGRFDESSTIDVVIRPNIWARQGDVTTFDNVCEIDKPELVNFNNKLMVDANLLSGTSVTVEASHSAPSVTLDLRNMRLTDCSSGDIYTTELVVESAVHSIRETLGKVGSEDLSTWTLNVLCRPEEESLAACYRGAYPGLDPSVDPDTLINRHAEYRSLDEFRMRLLAARPMESHGYLAEVFTPKGQHKRLPAMINRAQICDTNWDAYAIACGRFAGLARVQVVVFQLKRTKPGGPWHISAVRTLTLGPPFPADWTPEIMRQETRDVLGKTDSGERTVTLSVSHGYEKPTSHTVVFDEAE